MLTGFLTKVSLQGFYIEGVSCACCRDIAATFQKKISSGLDPTNPLYGPVQPGSILSGRRFPDATHDVVSPALHVPELLQDTDEHHEVRVDDHRGGVTLLKPFEEIVRHLEEPSK